MCAYVIEQTDTARACVVYAYLSMTYVGMCALYGARMHVPLYDVRMHERARAHARAQRTYKRNASVPTLSLPCPPGTRQTASASSSRTASSSVLGERDRRVRGASQGEDGGGEEGAGW